MSSLPQKPSKQNIPGERFQTKEVGESKMISKHLWVWSEAIISLLLTLERPVVVVGGRQMLVR